MSKINSQLKALFSTVKMLFAEMKELQTDQGVLYYEGELEVGVLMYNDGGLAPDGEYVAGDMIYVIKDGALAEKKEKPAEEEVPQESADEPTAEEQAAMPEPEIVVEPAPVPNEGPADGGEDPLNAVWAQITTLTNRITALEAEVQEMKGTPEGVTPQVEFSKVNDPKSLSDFGSGVEAIQAMRKFNRIK